MKIHLSLLQSLTHKHSMTVYNSNNPHHDGDNVTEWLRHWAQDRVVVGSNPSLIGNPVTPLVNTLEPGYLLWLSCSGWVTCTQVMAAEDFGQRKPFSSLNNKRWMAALMLRVRTNCFYLHDPHKEDLNSFIPENRYSGWENLSLHSWEPLERGRHKHSLPSGWPLQQFCLWNPRLSVTWSARQFPLASVTGPEECFDKPHNALISRDWPLPDCGKVSSAQNLSISRDGVRVFCTVGKMAGDEYNDSDQFSDDDVYDNLGENDFDLFELTEEERAELANAFKDDSESGDELDDENLPLFFTQPRFEWTGGGHCCDTRHTSDVQCRCVQRHSKYSCTELQWKHCVYVW